MPACHTLKGCNLKEITAVQEQLFVDSSEKSFIILLVAQVRNI